jgi:two-component system OmpR family sensor kinase
MKLRNRLVAVVTAVTVVALALSFVPLYLLVRAAETSDLDNALFRQASALAQHLPGTYAAGHPLDEGHADVPESIDPTVRYTAVYGPDQLLESQSESFANQAPPSLAALGLRGPVPWDGVAVDLEHDDNRLRGVVMPTGDRGEALLYAVSKSTVEDDTATLLELLLAIFVLAAGATALIARWLGERLARDVHSVARVARLVAEGDLAARVGDPRVMGADETRALASDLDHMISRLDEVVSSQRRFISHAAHELRSPLASLRGELQLALRRDRDAEEYRAALTEMLSSVDALIALAEDLLRLARAQGRPPPPRAGTKVADIVREALRMARGRDDERGVTVKVPPDLADIPVEVRGGLADLARVLRNLIDNAVTHSPPGGEVRVDVAVVDGGVELAVVDQGPGIPPADQPHIFTPFFRGADGESHEGAGLGLSIARGLAESCGGRLVLDTRHVGGTRMVLHLAFAEPAPPS